MKLPKVLILSQPFNYNTGGGITLSNLFSGWDKDRIAVCCLGYLIKKDTKTNICDTYYQLGHKEHKWAFPFNHIKRKYYSGLLDFGQGSGQQNGTAKSKFRAKLIMNFFNPFLKFLGLYHKISKITLSKDLCDWLDAYQPDIIYAQAQNLESVMFCSMVEQYLKKPMIFHMMDDWPSLTIEKGLFSKYWQEQTDLAFRALLDRSSLLLSISDHMAEEYKERYGKDFITFHNPIDIEFWKKHRRKCYEIDKDPEILYAGRTGLGIHRSLEMLAKAVKTVNKESGKSIKFVLQTHEKPQWIKKYDCVLHKGLVPYSELPQAFSNADFLYLPYDFSKESIKFIQYSMPTKAPEYMASGTPIIIFAPEVTAIVRYAEKYKWAKVITKNDLGTLTEAIRQLIGSKPERQEIAENASRLADANHSSQKVRADFKEALISAAEVYDFSS